MAHLNARLLWKKYAAQYFSEGKMILEIGPAGFPSFYQGIVNTDNVNVIYHSLDVQTDFISGAEKSECFILSEDPYNYPVEDNCYDIVFSDQVLAHVPFFWDWYKELVRITKPGGYIITICSQSYPSCPSPIDAWRVSSDGLEALNRYYKLETMVSSTESLEMELYKIRNATGHFFAGASIIKPYNESNNKVWQINKLKRVWNNIVGKIPILRAFMLNPVQLAFDTINIAQKP